MKNFLFHYVAIILMTTSNLSGQSINPKPAVYSVIRLEKPMPIDGNWNKPQWKKSKEIEIRNLMGDIPKFIPTVKAKMMFDNTHVYIIFLVNDHYVRSVATEINGRIWEDSCVEFFFAPDSNEPLSYFNLEINCGGVPLLHYKSQQSGKTTLLEPSDIKQIEIAHSMPSVVDPELNESVNWTIEYKIPLAMLEKFSKVTRPKKGSQWRANFYKCGDKTSNPHWITWSIVNNDKPNFHLPQFFGILNFK